MRSDLKARLQQTRDEIAAMQARAKDLQGDEAKQGQKEIAHEFDKVREGLSDDDKQEIRQRLVELSPARGTLSAVTKMESDDWQEYQFLLKLF
jgi:hypothetical protein